LSKGDLGGLRLADEGGLQQSWSDGFKLVYQSQIRRKGVREEAGQIRDLWNVKVCGEVGEGVVVCAAQFIHGGGAGRGCVLEIGGAVGEAVVGVAVDGEFEVGAVGDNLMGVDVRGRVRGLAFGFLSFHGAGGTRM